MSGRPVTHEEHRAAANIVRRWTVTYVPADGLRTLVYPCQGRYTWPNRQRAYDAMVELASGNSRERIREIYGPDPRFDVREVECWKGPDGTTGDPIGIYFES